MKSVGLTKLDIRVGDCRELLGELPDESVQCCVTSPPYWGLRDYGHAGQIGQEATPELFVQTMVKVFREVRRVMKADGVCWINLGDTYAAGGLGMGSGKQKSNHGSCNGDHIKKARKAPVGYKQKDLVGIPWMVAFSLRADGWYLRQDIIWAKPNPMPESVTDRCTKSHEYIFLLTKSDRYFYDHEAIAEDATTNATTKDWREREYDQSMLHHKQANGSKGRPKGVAGYTSSGKRNKRSVWTVSTKPYNGAHFATYPPDLIKPCILAGSRPGDIVLDPFAGSGTTGEVALELGRNALLIELNPNYAGLIEKRTAVTPGLALT